MMDRVLCGLNWVIVRLSRLNTQIEAVHAFQGGLNLKLKVSDFLQKAYTYYALSMLSMIVTIVAKLYVLYEHHIIFIYVLLHWWITIFAWHDIIGILIFVHGMGCHLDSVAVISQGQLKEQC